MPHQTSPSCAYCGVAAINSLIYCETVDAWFCNGVGKSLPRSHIVEHLRRSRGSQICHIQASRKGLFGKTRLECESCQNANVFDLGFQLRRIRRNTIFLRICCRLTCIDSTCASPWVPLVDQDGKFTRMTSRCFELSAEQDLPLAKIDEIEQKWQPELAQASEEVNALKKLEEEVQLPPKKPVKFETAQQYVETLRNVLRLEQKANEVEMKLRDKEVNVTVNWFEINQQMAEVKASFKLRQLTHGHHLTPGNTITMGLGNHWQSDATVLRSVNNNEVTVLLKWSHKTPVLVRHGFSIGWSFNNVPYDRMFKALENFSKTQSDNVSEAVLGKQGDNKAPGETRPVSAPGLPKLNKAQQDAISYALSRPLSIIEAPPGTGKTTLAGTLAYRLVTMGHGPVLLCAPSNIAADNLTSALAKTGLSGVVRLYARWREEDPKHKAACPLVNKLALHRRIQAMPCHLTRFQYKKEESKLLQEATVICSTCIAAGDPRLNGINFKSLIIDECTQAAESECLVPITRGSIDRVVLIGDRKQLGPIVKSAKARQAAFNTSLFERLGTALGSISLEMQYRMHPAISAFPSAAFYDSKLFDGISGDKRSHFVDSDGLLWPKSWLPVVFLSSTGGPKAMTMREEMSGSGTSFLNRHEADLVYEVLCRLFEYDVKPSQIGVITMYEGQREYLTSYLSAPMMATSPTPSSRVQSRVDSGFGAAGPDNWFHYCRDVEVQNVDGYQGRENDYIVISCVRSNPQHRVGFLSDPRRINVALTRARYGLIIIGDPATLERCATWRNVIEYHKKQGTFLSQLSCS